MRHPNDQMSMTNVYVPGFLTSFIRPRSSGARYPSVPILVFSAVCEVSFDAPKSAILTFKGFSDAISMFYSRPEIRL